MSVNKKYIILGAGIVIILFIGYIFVQGRVESEDKPVSNGATNTKAATGPVFKLEDLRGIEYILSDYKGEPVLVHFMAVGCAGEYTELNDNQLKQLKTICTSLCGQEKLTIFTVLVSTCDTTDLSQLYDMYNITWILGNDYQDNKLDIVEKYSTYEPSDGMVLLLDENLIVTDIIKDALSSDAIIEKILQLGG